MKPQLIFLTTDEHGVAIKSQAVTSISRVEKYARLSATQWSVDIFSDGASQDENQTDYPVIRGVHYKQFRDTYNTGTFESAQAVVDYINQNGSSSSGSRGLQGYYGLLSNFYFAGGQASDTVIAEADVDQWVDVNFTIDAEGLYDSRPTAMTSAQAAGHTGAGTQADPIVFGLEGLTTKSHAYFNASMAFDPDTDESQLETRILFERNSSSALGDFDVSEVTLNMNQGANEEYVAEPLLTFFCGDTISTVGPGDAGSCRFQVRSSSEGTLSVRALTWYISQ